MPFKFPTEVRKCKLHSMPSKGSGKSNDEEEQKKNNNKTNERKAASAEVDT